jgi:hypothetical protein
LTLRGALEVPARSLLLWSLCRRNGQLGQSAASVLLRSAVKAALG